MSSSSPSHSLSSYTFPPPSTSSAKAHLTLNSSILINPSVIPSHSSLPSPLSPPLSISPPSSFSRFSSPNNNTMADLAVSSRLNDSLPPRHPSSPAASSTSSTSSTSSHHNSSSTRRLQRATTSAPALPFIQTSPEEWLAHAAQQRRHLSTGSFSSITSSSSSSATSYTTGLFTPEHNRSSSQQVHSPVPLAFGESEQVLSENDDPKQKFLNHHNSHNNRRIPDTATNANGSDAGPGDDNTKEGGEEEEGEQEPLLNVNVRPSELRASLMARARRSSAKLQQQQQQQRTRSESSLFLEKGSRLSGLSNQSFSSASASAFDSSSCRLSSSSSISGWAPPSTRARSSSVSSHGSNDSVNLDALIAGGSDINEECPLDLEEGDDLMTVDWSKQPPLLEVSDDDEPVQVQQGQRSRRSTGASFTSSILYDDRQADDYWDEPEMTEDPAIDETVKGFSQMSMKHAIPEVRGLTSPKHIRTPSSSSASSRFPDGRNPFDLDADYMDSPSGLASPSSSNNRLSTYSQDSTISNRSSIGGSRLQPPGVSRLPGSSSASGLKAPVSRLAQPGVRSSTGVPQPTSKTGLARPSGLQTPKSGIQAPKSGLQAPKSGLQAPRTVTGLQAPRTGSSSSLIKPSAGGRTAGSATGSRLVAPGSRVPSKAGSGIAPPSTKSQLVAPGTVKRATSALTNGRNSTLLPSSTVTSRSASSSTLLARPSAGANGSRMLTSPQRTGTSTPTHLASPTRVSSGRLSSSSSHMVSPTCSQSSTSSLPSLAHARDTVTPLSQRLSNATGTSSQLMRPKAAGGATRSLSMYGSNSSLLPTSGRTSQQHHYHQQQQEEEEADYAVLTPPQSPSSKRVMGSGLPRSGMAMPSRLAAPSVSTARVPRSTSPAPLSAGSNSGGSSYLPRPHTPTSSLPMSRIPGGLISPRAARS